MPVTLAAPPSAVLAELAKTLPRLAQSPSLQARAPGIVQGANRFSLAGNLRVARTIDDVADTDAIPLPVYTVGLKDLSAGRLTAAAKLTLWSHVVATEAGAVSAEVSSETSRFAQITNGAAVARARASLLKIARGNYGANLDGEAAELRIPALHTSILWLKGANPTFEVLDSPAADLPEGKRFTEKELTELLRRMAAASLSRPDADG